MEKRWTWAACGYDLARYPFETIREICRTAGFSGIEGAPPLFEGRSDREIQSIGAAFGEDGLAIETFHLPFSREDDIAAFYETERREAVESMKRWLDRAALVGATKVIQHPTTRPYEVEVEGLDRFFRQLTKSLQELLPFAEDRGITVALENMLPRGGSRFGSHASHIEKVFEELAHPKLGICLDTGHALISAGEAGFDDFLRRLMPWTTAFHLADNAGDRDSHLAPGRGNVPWGAVFQAAAEAGFSGSMCIETPPFAAGPNYSMEAWIGLREDMDRLVKRAFRSPGDGSAANRGAVGGTTDGAT